MTQPNIPPKPNASNPFDDMPVIFSYTRKQAIEDGVLVDLSAMGEGNRVFGPRRLHRRCLA